MIIVDYKVAQKTHRKTTAFRVRSTYVYFSKTATCLCKVHSTGIIKTRPTAINTARVTRYSLHQMQQMTTAKNGRLPVVYQFKQKRNNNALCNDDVCTDARQTTGVKRKL